MRWKTGDKELKKSRFLQSIPGIICAEQPEGLRNSHTSCCIFMKHPLGEIISLRVNKPFSYQEIQRIKEDLGDCLEHLEKYISAFKGVTLLYDLTWQSVMYVLGQTLTPASKTRVLWKAVAYGDEWLGNEPVGKMEDKIATLPTENQVVPTVERDWDCNTAKGRWDQSHFVRCVFEGLRRTRDFKISL